MEAEFAVGWENIHVLKKQLMACFHALAHGAYKGALIGIRSHKSQSIGVKKTYLALATHSRVTSEVPEITLVLRGGMMMVGAMGSAGPPTSVEKKWNGVPVSSSFVTQKRSLFIYEKCSLYILLNSHFGTDFHCIEKLYHSS